jgi:hypothetical protein
MNCIVCTAIECTAIECTAIECTTQDVYFKIANYIVNRYNIGQEFQSFFPLFC